MSLTVFTPGPLSLLQDLGRHGHQHIGVSPGGPMDEHAFLWANRLLDNPIHAAQIEIAMGQFSCQFHAATTIALTGADMAAKLNQQPISPWQSVSVRAGDQLSLRGSQHGIRAYLAVKGGFVVTPVLNSCATVMRDNLGGPDTQGRKLTAQDCLRYNATPAQPLRRVPRQFIPEYGRDVTLEVIPGYQYAQFAPEQRQRFFSHTYTVTPQIDRMGYRLAGEAIICQTTSLISEGIALGAIQIPADGQPIILMRDRQTIGGYPKIGCLTASSLSKLAQCQPGAQIRFVEKDLYQAEAERMIEHHFFHSYVGKKRAAAMLNQALTT
ncbi:biotin-dependent carboxyltransferase family protein [Photobacterium sp. TY1-4]|uniref:5-oxoprolinase subunit C family protein n=1 Tax=Photobacterium sp. TY1-4 TaxID=2899122 RepID=UPI0021BF2707|nr:biotin-dependent carboxyltransferase family protein [Photobacterium sp. TY1-4]UXI04321.1 biotin-dependent carboxyltransferase family protein [Photobacterium sp. TY1-4]